jgi:mRNA-degrading endonuclease toxin of MazEF toxin-antitoxin module
LSLTTLVRNSFYDSRQFEFGSIWTIPDEIISIPDADRDRTRILHPARLVLVVSNNRTNIDPLTPVISIIPLSHRVDCIRYGDVVLTPERDGVRYESVARVRLLQPVLKADLVRCIGRVSDDACEELLVAIEDFFGLTIDEPQ